MNNWWLPALWTSGAGFEVSLAGVTGRMRAPQGWVARFCSSTQHLLYYVAEGAFDARAGEETTRVVAGDLLWAARGEAFSGSKRGGEPLVVWRFRLDGRGEDGEPLPFSGSLHLQAARSCGEWMERIVDEASEPGTASRERMRGLLACLLSEIVRHDEGDSPFHGLSRVQRETLRRLVADAHPRASLSPNDLARAVGLSPDYFSRCFRRSFGLAPRRFLLESRLQNAALRLLETSQNVSEIARELGYRDVFLFSRQFKAHFGHSPTAYRALHGAVQKPS